MDCNILLIFAIIIKKILYEKKGVAVVPMKLNNHRLPGKNIMRFEGGDSFCY